MFNQVDVPEMLWQEVEGKVRKVGHNISVQYKTGKPIPMTTCCRRQEVTGRSVGQPRDQIYTVMEMVNRTRVAKTCCYRWAPNTGNINNQKSKGQTGAAATIKSHNPFPIFWS